MLQSIVAGVGSGLVGHSEKNPARAEYAIASTVTGMPALPSLKGPHGSSLDGVVRRLCSITLAASRNEEKKAMIAMELKAANAVCEPIPTKAISKLITTVTPMAFKGIRVRGLTFLL